MTLQTVNLAHQPADVVNLSTANVLQRQCACGGPPGPTGECEACRKNREAGTLQRAASHAGVTNQAPPIVHEVLSSPGQPLDPATRAFMEPRFGHDFSQVRVHTAALQPTHTSLSIVPADDDSELEASRAADSVVRSADTITSGNAEPVTPYDFSGVRVHQDTPAADSARSINALAYTQGQHIVFGAGQYQPYTKEGRRLLAHELTHVAQQTGGKAPASVPSVQRAIEVRPPGRGEASAFDRRQELIDRLNTLSTAIQYRLDGRRIVYDLVDEAALTHFDRQIRGFIDRAEVVPMRLITSAGRVRDGGRFVPLLIDFFDAGYVDLDDLLASDNLSFQLNFIHVLTERFRVRNYARRIGTTFSDAEFDRAHRAGLDVEAELLRNVIGDPTIRFNFEETRPNGTDVFAFRSAEGYRVFHVFRRAGREERHGEIFVQTRDGRRLTIEQLIAERAAAAPAGP